MTLLSHFSVAVRSFLAAALGAEYNGGKLALYAAPRPADGDAAVGAAVKVVEYTLGTPAFAEANGVLTANVIAAADILASGVVTWARLTKADGSRPVHLSAGRNGLGADGVTAAPGEVYNLNLKSAVFAVGAEGQVTAFAITIPAVGA